MKNLTLLVAAIASLFITSCKKKDNSKHGIEGKWEMVLVTGGIGSVHLSGADLPYTQSYTFDKGSYTWVFDAKARTGQYTLGKENLNGTGKEIDVVSLGGGVDYQYSFRHDTLVLNPYYQGDITYEWFVRR